MLNSAVHSRPEIPSLCFSTDQFAARERAVAWREFVGRTFCRSDIEPLAPDEFAGTTIMRQLPGLGVISGNCSPLRYVQTRQLSDSDDVMLTLSSGAWELQHGGRTDALAAGDAVLTSAAGLGSYTLHSGGPHWGLRVPFALPKERAPSSKYSYGIHVKRPPGMHTVALLVRDDVSAETVLVNRAFRVPTS